MMKNDKNCRYRFVKIDYVPSRLVDLEKRSGSQCELLYFYEMYIYIINTLRV